MSFPKTTPTLIADAITELKANPRLRWGVCLIFAILWFYGILLLQDEVRERRQSYETTLRKMGRLQVTTGEDRWPARLEAAKALRADLESRLWHEATMGLAQARFQDWLTQAAQQAGLPKATINVAIQEDALPGERAQAPGSSRISPAPLWKASAKLAFDFNPGSLHRFLAVLAGYEKSISVETLAIRGTPAPRAEMTVVAHFLKPTQAREGAATEPKATRN